MSSSRYPLQPSHQDLSLDHGPILPTPEKEIVYLRNFIISTRNATFLNMPKCLSLEIDRILYAFLDLLFPAERKSEDAHDEFLEQFCLHQRHLPPRSKE
ncbi:RNA polymerase-associated protein RTF1 [Fusarium oxysporum f. sp. albedinis]|nr:RNA polymerase-associated protein RTF1 [Fusarium oxysporum f. sp. albedinis]